ncbi:MAG TPA: glutaredoxin family protein [Candidatus Thermoplasmatota archaeon]
MTLVRRELDIRLFRFIVRASLLAALTFVVLGLYMAIPRGDGESFVVPPRPFEDRPGLRLGLAVASIGVGVMALGASQYFRVRPDPTAENLLVLVSKDHCMLCDEARHVIREVTKETPFTLQEIDVRDHRHLARFKNFIPVLFWQGDELARLKVDPDELRTKLQGILRDRAERAEQMRALSGPPKGV